MLRDIGRKDSQEALERLRGQTQKDKNKLYAWHTPEVECVGKGKTWQPYEFGVKVGIAITAKSGLILGALSFPGNPYDGGTLAEHREQTGILTDVEPETVLVDLGYRDRELDGARVLHKGKRKTPTRSGWRWLKRPRAVDPTIGHPKSEHRMRRCHLKGKLGDALDAVLEAVGYKLRWVTRWLLLRYAWMGLSLIGRDDREVREALPSSA